MLSFKVWTCRNVEAGKSIVTFFFLKNRIKNHRKIVSGFSGDSSSGTYPWEGANYLIIYVYCSPLGSVLRYSMIQWVNK